MSIISMLTELATEIIVIVVFALVAIVAAKGKTYLNTLRKKDELGIIDLITDRVVEYAEVELKGKKGIEKRDFAVDKAIEILNGKGIKVNRDEVIAGIENGVTKARMNNQFLAPIKSEEYFMQ